MITMHDAPAAGPRGPLRNRVEFTGRLVVGDRYYDDGGCLDATEWVPTGGAYIVGDGAHPNICGERLGRGLE